MTLNRCLRISMGLLLAYPITLIVQESQAQEPGNRGVLQKTPSSATAKQTGDHAQNAIVGQPLASNTQKTTQAGNGVNLAVKVTDVVSSKGELMIVLYSNKAAFPDKFSKADYIARVKPNTPSHVFKNIRPGNYAVVVVHDLNKNKTVDKSLIGMPKEPLGLSNYTSIGFSNRPTFKKALISAQKSGSISVKLNSLGATPAPRKGGAKLRSATGNTNANKASSSVNRRFRQ